MEPPTDLLTSAASAAPLHDRAKRRPLQAAVTQSNVRNKLNIGLDYGVSRDRSGVSNKRGLAGVRCDQSRAAKIGSVGGSEGMGSLSRLGFAVVLAVIS